MLLGHKLLKSVFIPYSEINICISDPDNDWEVGVRSVFSSCENNGQHGHHSQLYLPSSGPAKDGFLDQTILSVSITMQIIHYIIQFYLVNFYLGCWVVGRSQNSTTTRNSCESLWWNLNPEKVKFNPSDKRHAAYVGMCVKEHVIVFETNERAIMQYKTNFRSKFHFKSLTVCQPITKCCSGPCIDALYLKNLQSKKGKTNHAFGLE